MESDLFASREVSFATAQLSNHRLLAAADLTLPNCHIIVKKKVTLSTNLMVAASAVKFELLQQVQASVPFSFIIWQLSTIFLKVSIVLTQAST